jgi:predicted permease
MSWFQRLFGRAKAEDELKEEIQFYLDQETQLRIDRGEPPVEARYAARRDFGNVTAIREQVRGMWGWNSVDLMHDLLADLRFTFRLFRSNVSFSLVAIGSMALGIGASSAIFSLIYAVLFDPYPYRDADRIIAPTFVDQRGNDGNIWYNTQDFLDLRENAKTLEGVFLSDSRDFVATQGLADRVKGLAYSPNFFDFMGVPAMLGRTFGPGDVPVPAAPPQITVLSYLFWQRHFQGDPSVVGRTIELNRQPYTILGVLPPRFTWNDADVYVPLALTPGNRKVMPLMARIMPGLALEAAGEELQAITERFAERSPGTYPKEFRMQPQRLNDFLLGRFQGTLLILLAAVGCLLLIAIGNVSILLLARASVRQKEVAVRLALGAGRGRVIRQLLTESVVLSAVGGLLGVLMAYRGVPAIVALMPEYSVPHEAVIQVNGAVVLFSFVISVAAGTLFGMAPALQLAKSDIRDTMAESGRALSGGGRLGRVRGLLIVSEVALTMVLLVGAGIAVRGLAALIDAPLGYDPSNIAWLAVGTRDGAYPTWQQRRAYFEGILEKLRAMPAVVSATATSTATPPWIGFDTPFETAGQAQPEPNQRTLIGMVSGKYFETIRVPLLRGRDFSHDDFARVQYVAVVNEAMQRQYFPNGDPVGQRIRVPALRVEGDGNAWVRTPPASEEWLEIVGVVSSARNRGLHEALRPAIYIPYTLALPPNCAFMVRTAGDPQSLFNSLRREVLSVDDLQPASQMRTLEEVLARSELAYPRFSTVLFTIFAIVGLLLAATGLYSVVSYTVTQRTQEFGIRMALGAARVDILRLVGGMAAKLMLAGMAIGLAGSLALSGLIAYYVQGWNAQDPIALGGVAALLLAVALVACWVPARRATGIQPVNALRHQ